MAFKSISLACMCNFRYRVWIPSLITQYRLLDTSVSPWYMGNTLNKNNHSIELCRPHNLAIDKTICRDHPSVHEAEGPWFPAYVWLCRKCQIIISPGRLRMQNLSTGCAMCHSDAFMKSISSKSMWVRDGCTQPCVQPASQWPLSPSDPLCHSVDSQDSCLWLAITQACALWFWVRMVHWGPWMGTQNFADHLRILRECPPCSPSWLLISPSAMGTDFTASCEGWHLRTSTVVWNLKMVLCLRDH